MDSVKKYLRQQLCLPPSATIQKWTEYMDAESTLLHDHRAANTDLLAQHVSDQSEILAEHAAAHSRLLAEQASAQLRVLAQQSSAHAKFIAEQSRVLAEQISAHSRFVAEQASAHSRIVAEHVRAQANQLAEHVSSQTKRLAEPVTAHAKLLDEHRNARAVLLSKFTGYINRREQDVHLTDMVSGLYGSVRHYMSAQQYLPIVIAVVLIFMSCLIGAYIGNYLRISSSLTVSAALTETIASRVYSQIPTAAPPAQLPTAPRLPERRGLAPNFRLLTTPPLLPLSTAQNFRLAITTFCLPLTAPLHRWYTTLPAPPSHDLAAAAQSASTLLSSFATTALASSGRFPTAQKQRLNAALAALLAIRATVYARYGAGGMLVKSEEMMVDAGCIICCAELVNIVLMPCRHMVVCETCCVRMGLEEGLLRREPVRCPVCRVAVGHTIKVFRG
ncbi:hypothetical protein Q9L58_009622 [Maublancomyces gigas]|uniref:RING-type domain-containing protein n=1 Tax=Discina gigas TaxID=1032678 RepID=A0ABR3G6D9_9PEZI